MKRIGKQQLRRWFVHGRLRAVVGPLYNFVIAQELALQRLLDARRPGPQEAQRALLSELTAVVKTFERPYALKRLLASIRRLYPELHVIIVDDGRQPETITGVEHVILPYDSGVSAGRQAGLRRVKTKYTLTLDDDFVFYRRTALPAALRHMEAHPQIDIMGGAVVNLPFFTTDDYSQATLFPTDAQPVLPLGSRIGGLPVYDKVPNFFIGRTARLRLVDWDPQLRRLDHADFFTRARGVLTSVYNADLRCLHVKTPFNAAYMEKRLDYQLDRLLLRRRYYGR